MESASEILQRNTSFAPNPSRKSSPVRLGRKFSGSDSVGDLVQRLWNWSRWARSDPDAPDGSCVNSIWDQWNPYGAGRDEGWGEPESAPGGEEIDEQDAEAMDCWVRQLHREPRALLVQRFVMRKRVSWDTLDPAVRALGDLIERNWLAVEAMRGKV